MSSCKEHIRLEINAEDLKKLNLAYIGSGYKLYKK